MRKRPRPDQIASILRDFQADLDAGLTLHQEQGDKKTGDIDKKTGDIGFSTTVILLGFCRTTIERLSVPVFPLCPRFPSLCPRFPSLCPRFPYRRCKVTGRDPY